jgi:hypothetical protein
MQFWFLFALLGAVGAFLVYYFACMAAYAFLTYEKLNNRILKHLYNSGGGMRDREGHGSQMTVLLLVAFIINCVLLTTPFVMPEFPPDSFSSLLHFSAFTLPAVGFLLFIELKAGAKRWGWWNWGNKA